MDALKQAIKIVGGVGKLAGIVGLRQSAVSNWMQREQVPAEHCIAIEAATNGQVTRYELREDVFGKAPEAPPAAKAEAA